MPVLLVMAMLAAGSPAHAGKKDVKPAVTPAELQSQIMSFADRFIARVNGAVVDYIHLKGYAKTPFIRVVVQGRKLAVSSAVVSIAAGPNPEVAMLDMVVLTSLLKLRTEDIWVGRKVVPHSEIFLEAYVDLEKDIWAIAGEVLSAEQARELRELINEWHKKNLNKIIAIASIRFGDFAKKRRQSTLIQDGRPKGFLKAVQEANREIEQTRALAERAMFLAERQPALMRWQIEQTFFELAMEPEFATVLSTAADIGQAGKQFSRTMEKLPTIIAAEREAAIQQAFRELGRERSETISQAISEISRERQALINQTSERILEKAFYLGLALILVLLLGAIVARLIYRYLEIRLFEKKKRGKPTVSVSKA